MYQYLYLIDILYSVNNTLNIITTFTFFVSLFLFIVYVCSDNSKITKKCKKSIEYESIYCMAYFSFDNFYSS